MLKDHKRRICMKQLIILFILSLANFNPIFASQALNANDSAAYFLDKSYSYAEADKAKSMSLLNKALGGYLKTNSEKGLAETYNAISRWFANESQWDTSMSLALKSLNYGEKSGDKTIIAKACLNLGNIYYNLKNIEKSKSFYQMAIRTGHPHTVASATSNLGLIYSYQGQIDSAKYMLTKALAMFDNLKDSSLLVLSNIAITNLNLGTISYDEKEYGLAKKYFNTSLRTSYKIKDFNNIVLNYLNFGQVFIAEKNFTLAFEVIDRASNISDSLKMHHLLNYCNYAMSQLKFAQGDFKTAYEMLAQFFSTKDSLSAKDIENKIANLQMKYESEKSQQQIVNLKNATQIERYRTASIIIFLVFSSLLVIFYLNKRRVVARNRMEVLNKQKVEAQKNFEKAQNDIVYFTKLIQENTERIECFEKELLSSYRNSDEVTQKQEKLRTMKILRDEDWVYYKTLFSEVYSSFYNKMMSIPDLSEGDRRQVLLLKMGYTHKMSADVLGISTEGIKRARQRLARKLNLLDASKLEEYIQKL